MGAWIVDFAPGNPSGALEVIGLRAEGATPCQIAQELNQILSAMPDVQHVTATILADKVEMICALAGLGFEISAYLPAWYRSGSFRYDCVQLARRQYDGEAATQDYSVLFRRLREEFQSSPILRPPEKGPLITNWA